MLNYENLKIYIEGVRGDWRDGNFDDVELEKLLSNYLNDVKELYEEINRLRPIGMGFCSGPDVCPTWHDGCNCTVEVIEHNIDRAEKAEDELRRLRGGLRDLMNDTGINPLDFAALLEGE